MPKPYKAKHRGKHLATVYPKCQGRESYRVAWRVKGQRQMRSFRRLSEAKAFADAKAEELYRGAEAATLTDAQARDASAALEHLRKFYAQTGVQLSLAGVAQEYCSERAKLNGHTLAQAVDGFLSTVATVKRKPLAEAVTDYLAGRKADVEAITREGKKRPPSAVYEYNVGMWAEEFANTFPGYAVCDLKKEHLDTYLQKFGGLSAKSRNDRRAVLRMLLSWCVRKDYLAPTHRLFEADKLKAEDASPGEIEHYRPKELAAMLKTADANLRPVIALGGLGGLRREEILRLDWADVWRVKGKVEISKRIAKGRKRRLVSVCAALGAWLRPYRRHAGPVWGKSPDALEEALASLRDGLNIPARRNGLRHGFATFHMALYSNENLTAAEAGNSPQMLHEHYRGLATPAEARKWFGVRPAKAASGTEDKIVELNG